MRTGTCPPSLDYSRLQYCGEDVQRSWFERQLQCICPSLPIAKPLFLHMRDAADDFIAIVGRNRHLFTDGVVHSFTGTLEEALRIIALDLYIGINGWYASQGHQTDRMLTQHTPLLCSLASVRLYAAR